MNTKNCLFNYDIIENNNNEGGEIMNNNKLVVPGSKQALEAMKYEIARELGINLGADTTSRLNGTVGGEMTRRLVKLGEEYYGKQAR
jgi:hypothetical protein